LTRAVFRQQGSSYDIQIDGHAGFNPGNDIVCAACSMLAFSLLQYVMGLAAEGKAQIQEATNGDGKYRLRFSSANAEEAVKVIAGGFMLLSSEYPHNVRFWREGKTSETAGQTADTSERR